MTVTNGAGKSRTGPVWRFTTGAGGSTTINRPPSASSQSVSALEDTSAPITLSATDPDGDAIDLHHRERSPAWNAERQRAVPIYQPAANYNGADSFTFRVNDGQADSNIATVSIAVQAVNDPPLTTGESYTVAGWRHAHGERSRRAEQ